MGLRPLMGMKAHGSLITQGLRATLDEVKIPLRSPTADAARPLTFEPRRSLLVSSRSSLRYLLRFERVDSLGAYRIPSETGILISSDFSNYR